jgi:hypothetical protein
MGDRFNTINIFNQFDGLLLFDTRFQLLKNFLKQVYNIDYCGIHAFDKDIQYLYSVRDNSLLHEFYWQNNIFYDCKAVQKLINLKKDENGILFFQSYEYKIQTLHMRAFVIGRKKSGFSVLLQDKINGNKVMFCITFKDDACINNMNKSILFSLINHLNQYKTIINPFLSWFKKIGNLSPTLEMQKEMKKIPFII